MTDQQTAFERDTDEIAPKAQTPDAMALWEAVEVLQSAHHLYYIHANGVGGSRVEVARADICAVAPTLADALIALAGKLQGGQG